MVARDSDLLTSSIAGISRLLTSLKKHTEISIRVHDELLELSKELYLLQEYLSKTLELDASDLVNQMSQIASLKDIFTEITEKLQMIEPLLSHVLDVVENSDDSSMSSIDIESIFDTIEDCNKIAIKNEFKTKALKKIVDTYLDFNEISENHMISLDDTIKQSISQLFEIFELKNSSPIRHTPSFTLEKIVQLLSAEKSSIRVVSSNNEHNGHPNMDEQPKFPLFCSFETNLSKKFLQLKEKLIPIEKSLIEILPKRIANFDSRTFEHKDDLLSILNAKYEKIMVNYEFLSHEINNLKIELIDDRWNNIFEMLNNELKNKMKEIFLTYEKVKSDKYSEDIQIKFKQRLDNDTTVVSRTFNVIYKALEFSLLRTDIAAHTNDLAENWIDIRELVDDYLLESPIEVKEETLGSIILPKTRIMRETNVEKINGNMMDLDFIKPPSLARFDSTEENTSTDDEQDTGNLTTESISHNLRSFSLTSNLNRTGHTKKNNSNNSNSNSNSNSNGSSILKKMSTPFIIPSITSSPSRTTISPEHLEGFDNDNSEENNPFFDSSARYANQKKSKRKSILNPLPETQVNEKLESLRYICETSHSQPYQLTNNNSDFDSDNESSRIENNSFDTLETEGVDDMKLVDISKTITERKAGLYTDFESTLTDLKSHIAPLNSKYQDTEIFIQLETKKLKYYATQKSKIPRVTIESALQKRKAVPQPSPGTLDTPSNFSYLRKPSHLSNPNRDSNILSTTKRRIRQPTTMSELSTPVSRL